MLGMGELVVMMVLLPGLFFGVYAWGRRMGRLEGELSERKRREDTAAK